MIERPSLVVCANSLELFDQRRPLDAKQIRGPVAIALRAVERALDEVALDRREIAGQVEAVFRKVHEGRRGGLRRGLNFRRQIRGA